MKIRTIKEELIKKFEIKLKNDEKSLNTREKYIRDVRCFARFIGESCIEKGSVLEYKAFLGKEYAVASANSMLASLNSFLRFAGWVDLCVKQFKVQRKTYCSKESELTKDEYISLVRAAEHKSNRRLSLLIQTICTTGIRVSELEFITVEALRNGEVQVFCKGKSRKVFIVKELCRKLARYAKEQKIASGAIFITKNGKSMSRSNVWREMKALCKSAGVSESKVFPHNLRHLFARTFYGIEKDIAKLADILGHTSIETTRIYIMTSGEEHRRKLECMHLVI